MQIFIYALTTLRFSLHQFSSVSNLLHSILWGSSELRIPIPNDIHQQTHTIKQKSYVSLRKLLQVSAQKCHPQGFRDTKEYKHYYISLGGDCWCLYSFVSLNPWGWHFCAETFSSFLRLMYDLYLTVCICWWMRQLIVSYTWLDKRTDGRTEGPK
jgi:hypothetical protein